MAIDGNPGDRPDRIPGHPGQHIEAQSITLKSHDGQHKVTLAAMTDGVGLWVEGPAGRLIAINSMTGQRPAIEFYASQASSSVPYAFSLDDDGEAVIQIPAGSRTENVRMVKLRDLLALLEAKA